MRPLSTLDPRSKARKPPAPFALGTSVVYTRRAAVARRKRLPYGAREWGIWSLYDGWPLNMNESWDPVVAEALNAFAPGERVNKGVLVWEEEGSGVIVGLVKKQTGESTPSMGGGGTFGDDFEPGYFTPVGDPFWLYAIRQRLDGLDFIFAPVDAVRLP